MISDDKRGSSSKRGAIWLSGGANSVPVAILEHLFVLLTFCGNQWCSVSCSWSQSEQSALSLESRETEENIWLLSKLWELRDFKNTLTAGTVAHQLTVYRCHSISAVPQQSLATI